MIKRPRSSKDREDINHRMNKRLKEDHDLETRQEEDYVNVTYPQKNADKALPDRGLPSTAPQVPQATALPDLSGSVESIHQGKAQLLRYNRLKLQHQQGNRKYEIKVVYTQCDSDNSSIASSSAASDMNEPHNELDCIRKEREHYNKLKVNIDQIPANKKLLRGVKVLNAESNTPSLNDTSSPVQSRKLTHRSAKVASVNDEFYLKVPPHNHTQTKYKKEGHANQLHSVTRKKVLHSLQNSMKLSPALPKSKSTGDILQMNQEQDTDATHQLAHSKSFQSMELLTPETTANQDNLHLRHPKVSPLTTCTTEESYNNCSKTDLSFMKKIITFTCGQEGKEITSAAYGFSVSIPKGTVRRRKAMEFQVGVCLHGPFTFPRGYKLVSPIIMVASQTHTKLKKPVEVALSHCMSLTPKTEKSENINFFRARRKVASQVTQSPNTHLFQATDGHTNSFQFHNSQGKLTSTDLGFFCIMAKETMNMRKHTAYWLVPVVPKQVESTTWRVHYCVTYHLEAFMKEIEEQFGPNWETLPPKQFKLEARVGAPKMEKIEINFQKMQPECGWVLHLESENKVHTSDIDSWTMTTRNKPLPKFTIRLCGDFAISSSVAQIWFTGPGMSQDLTVQLALPLIGTPPSPVQSSYPDSISSFSSTSIQFGSTVGSFLSNGEYDHLPLQQELDQTHIQLTYHNGYIDFPKDEDLQVVSGEVNRAMDREWQKLQEFLEIPEYTMLDIMNQGTRPQQICRLLKEWRQHSHDSSKEELARRLRLCDSRLYTAAAMLFHIKH